jgi:hypothetical protein
LAREPVVGFVPPTPGSELHADDAQVVGRFEVGNPVVEETDTVRFAKAIQFVEPDRPLAQPLSEVLEEQLDRSNAEYRIEMYTAALSGLAVTERRPRDRHQALRDFEGFVRRLARRDPEIRARLTSRAEILADPDVGSRGKRNERT